LTDQQNIIHPTRKGFAVSWTKRLCAFAASLMIVGSVVAWGQNEPTTKPSETGMDSPAPKAPARAASGRWGFAPYNRLSTVTDEQKQQISEIRRRMNAERKAIDEREEAEVMAVLTDEQKAELEQLEADRKVQERERRAAARQQQKKEPTKEDEDKDK
jgi:Spy/CpxP family protein refolding chaperone